MEFINSAKRTFVNNKGWSIILIGVAIAIVGTIVSFPVASLLSFIIKPLFVFLDYDIRTTFVSLPRTILSTTTTSVAISFIIANLMHIAKNQSVETSVEEKIQIGYAFIKKYMREIGMFLVLPKVILEVVSEVIVAIAISQIIGSSFTSMLMYYANPIKGWFVTVGLVTLFAGISLLVNYLCTIKFLTYVKEIRIEISMIRQLYVLAMIAAASYTVISLIPLLGMLAGIFIIYGYYAVLGSVIIVSSENQPEYNQSQHTFNF